MNWLQASDVDFLYSCHGTNIGDCLFIKNAVIDETFADANEQPHLEEQNC